MIKVIAIDMDGTLLNAQNEIEKQTVATIRKAKEQGIKFIIATGRGFSGVKRNNLPEDLEFDYILHSGAEIRNSEEDVLEENSLTREKVENISKILEQFPVLVEYASDKYSYVLGGKAEKAKELSDIFKFLYPVTMDSDSLENSYIAKRSQNFKYVSTINEIYNDVDNIFKIQFRTVDFDLLAEIKNILDEIPGIAVASSFDFNLEITDIKAQKGPSIKSYIEKKGYSMDEVMVIGDSYNDLSMLSLPFGATVAMGNAKDKIKSVAQYVTKSNSEQGVAHAINAAINNSFDILEK